MNIYLAGGMKSGWQDKVKAAMPEHHYYDPRNHNLIGEHYYTKYDLMCIRNCDLVLAYMEEDNPSGQGLALEVGYAHALGKTVVYAEEQGFANQGRSRYFGMVRVCSDYNTFDLNRAIQFIQETFPKV